MFVYPACWLAVLHAQNFNTGHYAQTFLPDVSHLACLCIGTINFYHFIPLLVTLNLARGHELNVRQNLLATFFHTLVSWSWSSLIRSWHISSWTCWLYFWVRFNETREINDVLLQLANIQWIHSPYLQTDCRNFLGRRRKKKKISPAQWFPKSCSCNT